MRKSYFWVTWLVPGWVCVWLDWVEITLFGQSSSLGP